MPKKICIPCSLEFDSVADYDEHDKSGHSLKEKGITLGPPPPPGVPPGVPLATPEFIQMAQNAKSSDSTAAPLPQHPPLAKPEQKPIVLSYIYTGTCPTCNVNVGVVELDVELEVEKKKVSRHFAVCICPVCKAQLTSREVVKL